MHPGLTCQADGAPPRLPSTMQATPPVAVAAAAASQPERDDSPPRPGQVRLQAGPAWARVWSERLPECRSSACTLGARDILLETWHHWHGRASRPCPQAASSYRWLPASGALDTPPFPAASPAPRPAAVGRVVPAGRQADVWALVIPQPVGSYTAVSAAAAQAAALCARVPIERRPQMCGRRRNSYTRQSPPRRHP